MTEKEFYATNWHRGNVAKLENGKEYLVKATTCHGKYLVLYSEEYDSKFIADYRIVVSRTSDYEEPIEVYLEHKRKKREAAEAKREAERQELLRLKAEKKQKNIEAQERAHQEAVARKEAAKKKKQKDNVMTKSAKFKVEASKVAEPKQKSESAPVTPKVEEPVAEAPKKRVRQRIRISQTVTEKVSFYKKK